MAKAVAVERFGAEVRLVDYKPTLQPGGVAEFESISTDCRHVPARSALDIASAGNPSYCALTNWPYKLASSGKFG